MTFQIDREWWKEIFDDLYLLTDGRTVCDPGLTAREVDFMESVLPPDKAAPVLDLCGGQGRHAIELAIRGFTRVTVLDYSDCLIRKGRETAEKQGVNTQFVRGDARDTNLDSDRFESVVIMGGSFGYFVADEENRKILKESFRMLKPGGTLLLDLPDKEYVLENFQPVSCHEPGETIRVTRHRKLEEDVIYCNETVTCTNRGCLRESTYCIRLYGPGKISRMLERTGFRDISFKAGFMDRKEKGDYGTMTNRMVVTGRKPGGMKNRR